MPVLFAEDPWLETVQAIGETPSRVAGILMLKREVEGPPKPDDFHSVNGGAKLAQRAE